MIKLLIALLLVGVVVFQWFAQQVWLRIWGPFGVTIHREEWPAFYWSLMVIETVVAGLLVYWFFATTR